MMRKLLKKYESIIISYKIFEWDSEPTSYRFKIKITFVDDSTLMVRDYFFGTTRKYAFHWQSEKDILIARWDNTMHWKDIETFPHHKHEKDKVLPSLEVTLEDVLNHIYNIMVTIQLQEKTSQKLAPLC